MRRRRAKVAGLPQEIRAGIDQRLQDGWKYREISAWLAETGHPGISEDNVRRWYAGGHQDFLKAQKEVVRARHEREAVLEFARRNGGATLQQANQVLAAAQTFETLRKFDMTRLNALLKRRPDLYLKTISAWLRLTKK